MTFTVTAGRRTGGLLTIVVLDGPVTPARFRIELAFATLEAILRVEAACTSSGLWDTI